MDIPNFDTMGRIPVRPLSFENKDLAKAKELIIDYNNGIIYVKTESGNLVNVTTNKEAIKEIAQYIIENSNDFGFMLLNANNKLGSNGKIFLANKTGKFGGTKVDGNLVDIIYIDQNNEIHIGHFGENLILKIDNPIIFTQPIILTRGVNFGFPEETPNNPKDGTLFFQIMEGL